MCRFPKMTKLASVLVLFSAVVAPVQYVAAQDLRNVEPQPVPESRRPSAPEEPSPDPDGQQLDTTPFGVDLRGLVFLSHPDQISRKGVLVDEEVAAANDGLLFSLEPLPILKNDAFLNRLSAYDGAALSPALLQEIQNIVLDYFTEMGRPFVNISVPPQDIDNGIIQVLVVEGKVGTITVQGHEWFSEDNYLDNIRLKSGDPIRDQELQEDIAWINRNSFRTSDVVTKPGTQVGDTDLTVVTNERFPLRVYASHDNAGTRLSGKRRNSVGLNWGNAFGLGHEFNYQHTRAMHSRRMRAHSGSYVAPLPWRHIASVSASYSKSQPAVEDPFDSTGRSFSITGNYTVPLNTVGGYTDQLNFSLPFKSSDNTLLYSDSPVTDNVTHVVQAEAGYSGNATFDDMGIGFSGTLVASPGGVTARNENRYFDASRSGAKANYLIGRGAFSFSKPLPGGLRVQGNINAQLASGNLLGSEQVSMTGVNAVRGYKEGKLYRDEAIIGRFELYAPTISMIDRIPGIADTMAGANLPSQDSLTFLSFLDLGAGRNRFATVGEDSAVTVASVGLGLRYVLGPLVSVSADYGWELADNADSIEDLSSRLHLKITVGY